MGKTALNFVILFFVLIISQVVICNNICLFNTAIPIIFIYLIVRLPLTLNINIVLTIAFLTGLLVDIFSNTQGMNALACAILSFVRRHILRLYVPREEDFSDDGVSIKSIGFTSYFKFLLTIVFLYCAMIFTIESFSFFNPLRLIKSPFNTTGLKYLKLNT